MLRFASLLALVALVEVPAAVAVVPDSVETNYAFRARMAELHPNRLAEDAAPVGADETTVDASWRLVCVSEDETVRHAVADLKDYFAKSMGVRLGEGAVGAKTIVVAVDPSLEKLQAKIAVTDDCVRVTGVTPRETLQCCYRLEDLLNRRGRPALARGSRTFTRLFSPRMTHSGWEIEKFPDVYMDQVAHAGMDAILVYVSEPPDGTRNGREDFPALVRRAARHGLDVYAYADFPVKAAGKHPLDEGAEAHYDATYGSIVKNAPGLKGLICVGESVAFPSRDDHTASYWWADRKTRIAGKSLNGFWPSPDWKDWLELVTKVTRRYKPDFDVVFWTYNWFWAPEKDRLALLETIPTNVSVHVTFEMGAPSETRDGAVFHVDDYSITEPGPGTTFASEAQVCRRRGIPLTTMSNTGGRTWDFGGLPFEPVPYAWLARFRRLREAQERWGLKGTMDSHHYGFTPNFVAEIAKAAFTREFDEREIEVTMKGIAARHFGFAQADEVLVAWKDWSEAFRWHSARSFDQYGPLRTGPSYPFNRPGVTMPDPPHPQYEYYDGVKHGTGWKYVSPSYGCPEDQLAPRMATDAKEIALLESGNARLAALMDRVPPSKRKAAERMLGLGKYMASTIRTLRNVRAYRLACLRKDEAGRCRILDEEASNVRQLLPWVGADSALGFEPSMRYVTDPEMLRWKLGQLAVER